MKKYIPRIYFEESLKINQKVFLPVLHIKYISKVLRMENNDIIEIFNNTNYIFVAKITCIFKKIIQLKILEKKLKNVESPLYIHLGQVISKENKMNFSIQKSVELGVSTITPLLLERNNFNKQLTHNLKKIQHWKKIAISACQQSCRNIVPKINNPENIFSWCKKINRKITKIVFDPTSILTINNFKKKITNVYILIGCEHGFSNAEMKKITQYDFIKIKLGPRVLRTETAAITAITALQVKFGDLS